MEIYIMENCKKNKEMDDMADTDEAQGVVIEAAADTVESYSAAMAETFVGPGLGRGYEGEPSIVERFRLVYDFEGDIRCDADGQPIVLVCDDKSKRWRVLEVTATDRHDGYLRAWHNGRLHLLHRVIAELALGPCPDGMQVDHMDGDKLNNNPLNLRYCSPSQNAANAAKPRRNEGNADLPRGVYRHGKRFRASIQVEGETIHGKTRSTVGEALADRITLEARFQGEFALSKRGN